MSYCDRAVSQPSLAGIPVLFPKEVDGAEGEEEKYGIKGLSLRKNTPDVVIQMFPTFERISYFCDTG